MSKLKAEEMHGALVPLLNGKVVRMGDTLYITTEKLVKNINGKPLAKKEKVVAPAKVLEIHFYEEDGCLLWRGVMIVRVPVYERDGTIQMGANAPFRDEIKEEEDALKFFWSQEEAEASLHKQ